LQHNLLKKGFDIMTKIYRSLTDLIGNTPLLELTNYNRKFAPQATIIAKLEYFNPAGMIVSQVKHQPQSITSFGRDFHKHTSFQKLDIILLLVY
jgi:hypothetical protein